MDAPTGEGSGGDVFTGWPLAQAGTGDLPSGDEGDWQPAEPHYYVIREGTPARIEGYDGPVECPGSCQAFRLVSPKADGPIETVWWHLEVWKPPTSVADYLNRRGWNSHRPHASDARENTVCWLTGDIDTARRILADDEWERHTPIFRSDNPF